MPVQLLPYPSSRDAIMPIVSQFKSNRGRGFRTSTRLVALGLGLLVSTPGVSAAQSLAARDNASSSAPSIAAAGGRKPVVGERARYELRLGGREIGNGSLEVLGEAEVNGHNTLHTSMQISGGWLFAKVNDRFDSWIDPEHLFSRRFVQDQKELTSKRYRAYEMAPEQKTFREREGEPEAMSSHQPLDDVSFLFYARTLPLRVGDVDTIPRYFKPGRDVILRVLRKERITVPAGTYETIVVQPTITNAGGLFGQGGHAEVYFSDDAARTLVMLKSRVPLVGSLSLHLTDFRASK
jgi:hypothetical protein